MFRFQYLAWQQSTFTIAHIDPAPQDVGIPHRAWEGAEERAPWGFETAFHAGSWIWSSENYILLCTSMNKGKKKGPRLYAPVLKQSRAFMRRGSASSGSRVPFEELSQLLDRCERMGFDADVVE